MWIMYCFSVRQVAAAIAQRAAVAKQHLAIARGPAMNLARNVRTTATGGGHVINQAHVDARVQRLQVLQRQLRHQSLHHLPRWHPHLRRQRHRHHPQPINLPCYQAIVATGVQVATHACQCQAILRLRKMKLVRRVPTMGSHGGHATSRACVSALEASRLNIQRRCLRLRDPHLLRQRHRSSLHHLHRLHRPRRRRRLPLPYHHGSRKATLKRFSRT